jgi:uncharacterized RDD family membrane protein YckC
VRRYPKADLRLRIRADVADGFLIFLLFLVPFVLGSLFEEHSGVLLKLSVAGLFFGLLYVLFRDGIGGASWGKRRNGLQVIRIRTGEPCGLVGSLVRNFIGVIPFIGFLDLILLFAHERGQRLGDRIMQIQVVEVDDVLGGAFEEDSDVGESAEGQFFSCGSCHGQIHQDQRICPHCGVEIDWEG